MPQEVRRITFARDEILKSLAGYCGLVGINLPNSKLTGMEINDDPERTVVMSYEDASEVALDQEHMAAALIRYCREINVPVPHSGQKMLHAKDGKIALMVNVNWDEEVGG